MARIAGINVPDAKDVGIALTHIYGVGRSLAQQACHVAGVDPATKVKDLSEPEIVKLRDVISKFNIEGDLRREIAMNIRRLVEIGAYRGIRHRTGLPVHGQRTRTNARGRKGVRKTVSRGGRRV